MNCPSETTIAKGQSRLSQERDKSPQSSHQSASSDPQRSLAGSKRTTRRLRREKREKTGVTRHRVMGSSFPSTDIQTCRRMEDIGLHVMLVTKTAQANTKKDNLPGLHRSLSLGALYDGISRGLIADVGVHQTSIRASASLADDAILRLPRLPRSPRSPRLRAA